MDLALVNGIVHSDGARATAVLIREPVMTRSAGPVRSLIRHRVAPWWSTWRAGTSCRPSPTATRTTIARPCCGCTSSTSPRSRRVRSATFWPPSRARPRPCRLASGSRATTCRRPRSPRAGCRPGPSSTGPAPVARSSCAPWANTVLARTRRRSPRRDHRRHTRPARRPDRARRVGRAHGRAARDGQAAPRRAARRHRRPAADRAGAAGRAAPGAARARTGTASPRFTRSRRARTSSPTTRGCARRAS